MGSIIHLKINGQNIFLNEWKKSSVYTASYVRYSIPGENQFIEYIYIDVNSISHNINIDFMGPNLGGLASIYNRLYCNLPQFKDTQLIEAQQHIDNFLLRFETLAPYI